MSNIGICEYCKYKNTDMIHDPCFGCSAKMGAFEFDLSEHDKQIRADVIDECIKIISDTECVGNCKKLIPCLDCMVNAFEKLKDQNMK